MRLIALAMLSGFASMVVHAEYSDRVAHGPTYKLYFPKFKREETDTGSGRIESLKVVVQCGFIVGVSKIPHDWSIAVTSPLSGEVVLESAAGHGSTALWRLETWNGSISILPYDMRCFDVQAEILTAGPDEDPVRKIKYQRSHLRLMK